jgi:hypothetical protein
MIYHLRFLAEGIVAAVTVASTVTYYNEDDEGKKIPWSLVATRFDVAGLLEPCPCDSCDAVCISCNLPCIAAHVSSI